jgi:hypothetical protein
MKKTYAISLDDEKVEEFKKWLEIRGLTFSGYINSMIDEQISAIRMFSLSGGPKRVSTVQLLKLAGKMAKSLKKEV